MSAAPNDSTSATRPPPTAPPRAESPSPAEIQTAWLERREQLERDYPRPPHLLWRPTLDLDPIAGLHAPKVQPPGSVAVVTTTRGAFPGHAEKIEWRLLAKPPQRIARGIAVAICGLSGTYIGPTRTVTDVVSTDKHWITFLLSEDDLVKPVHTLTVPVEDAVVPLFVRILRFLFARWLPDEHPGIALPLPPFTHPGCV
ncbi:hypothetical protein EIP86_009109 [Pleurotus ostreatoroseus]|nr:hypothetical protein EIP86_009109 [Pleurotus ostreatoroseus]